MNSNLLRSYSISSGQLTPIKDSRSASERTKHRSSLIGVLTRRLTKFMTDSLCFAYPYHLSIFCLSEVHIRTAGLLGTCKSEVWWSTENESIYIFFITNIACKIVMLKVSKDVSVLHWDKLKSDVWGPSLPPWLVFCLEFHIFYSTNILLLLLIS